MKRRALIFGLFAVAYFLSYFFRSANAVIAGGLLNSAFGWRAIFGWGALVILLSALGLMLGVRNTPPGHAWHAGAAGGAGFGQVFRDTRFWRIALVSFFHVGIVLAVQGLWGGPYLLDVVGLSKLAVGNVLLALGAGVVLGYFMCGWLADRLYQQQPQPGDQREADRQSLEELLVDQPND